MDIDNIEEFVIIEKRIDAAEEQATDNLRESIRDRWEFGRLMLAKRKGKQLPRGVLTGLVEATGKGQRELGYRMQFADRYPTEDEVCNALQTFTSWREIIKSLPKSDTRQRNSERDAQIAELKEQGKTREEIAAAVGIAERSVDNALRAKRAADEARAEVEAETTDWSTLPGSQREKLEKAKASISKRLEKEFRARLLAELDQHRAKLDADFAAYKAKLDADKAASDAQDARFRAMRDDERRRYQAGIEAFRAKGLITPDDYNVIRSCLHPDSRASATDEKLAAAFRLFNDPRIKTLLVKETP